MAQATTLILMPQVSYNDQRVVGYMINGEKQQAASYYFGNKDLQTLTWTLIAFTGLVSVQATLAEDPTEDDWFTAYTIPGNNTTQTSYHNLQGNFVWLRVKVSGFQQGVVQFIKVSY